MVTRSHLYSLEVIFNDKDDKIIESAKCNYPFYKQKPLLQTYL